jgi:hypothetical protein
MGEEKTTRSECALRRATIVEKWWWGKVKREVKQSEVLQKEIRLEEWMKGRQRSCGSCEDKKDWPV